MNRRKLLLVVVGTLIVLVALIVGLALTPGVQTWAVRRAVANTEGATITVGRVAAGFSSAELTHLRVEQPGMVANIARVDVGYSASALVLGRRLELSRLNVDGLEVDLRSASPATPANAAPGASSTPVPVAGASGVTRAVVDTSDAPAAFRGLFEQAVLPLQLKIATLKVDGRALLSASQTATFSLDGGGIAPGAEGRVNVKANLVDTDAAAAVRGARIDGVVTVLVDNDSHLNRVNLQTSTIVEGEGLPADALGLAATLQRAEGGREDYTAKLTRPRGAVVDTLLDLRSQFDPTTSSLSGAWDVAMPREALAALLTGLSLPELALNGSGTFGWQASTGAATTAGTLRGQVARLTTLSPALESVGAVQFETTFEAQTDAASARLSRLELNVATPEGVTLAEVRSLQPVSFVFANQTLTFANAGQELARIAVRALPVAWAQPFAAPLELRGGTLSAAFTIRAEADGSRVEARTAEPLAVRDLTVAGADGLIVENVSLTVSPTINYAAGALSAGLAQLEVTSPAGDAVRGSVRADIADLMGSPATTFAVQLGGRVVSLHRAYLPFDSGALAFAVDLAGVHGNNVLDLSRATASVRRDPDQLIADVALRSPLKFDLAKGELTSGPGLAVGLQLGTIPLVWAQSYVEGLAISGELTGGTVELVAASAEDFSANTVAPVTIRGLTLALNGQAMAKDLDVTLDATGSLRGQTLTYEMRRVEAAQAGAALLTANASGTVNLGGETLTLTSKGKLAANAAALGRQPALAPYATLSRGRVTADFDASLGAGLDVQSQVTLREAVATTGNQALGDVDFSVTLATKADGTGSVTLPLKVVAGGRASDVAIDGTFAQNEKGLAFNGTIKGKEVRVDDLQAFTVLAPATEPAATPTKPATPAPRGTTGNRPPATTPAVTRDTQPFWSGVTGRVQADLATVYYGPDTVIRGLRGVVVLTETRLALETIEGRIKEDPFKFTGAIAFNAQQPKPYALTGNGNVANLDLGALLKAANPQEKPTVETKVTATGRLTGSGANLDDLLQHVQGTFDVTGSGGVLRALGRRGETVGRVSSLIGLVGAIQGSSSTMATAELASQLNELTFESVKMKVERGADLDVKLTSLEFVSPTSRVTGTGTIAYQEGVPLTKQPLRLQLALAGKGALAQILNRVGMLTGQQDEREYYTMSRAFSISGTPLSPDSGDLWRFVTEAALRAATTRRAEPAQGEGQDAQQPATPTQP